MNKTEQLAHLQNLKKGDKITVVRLTGMATTCAHRVVFDCLSLTVNPRAVSTPLPDGIYFKESTRHKQRNRVLLNSHSMIFAGHIPAPFVDMDTDMFAGDCQINLIGDPTELRARIENEQLNPYFDQSERITHRPATQGAKTQFAALEFPDSTPLYTA